jgi:Flp pilus assembly pilin Flp
VARTTPTPAELNVRRVIEEAGQTMAEYAVILSVITSTVIAAVLVFGTSVGSHIMSIAELLP